MAELRESYTALTARADQSKFHDRVAAVVLHYGRPDETALAVRALRASNPPLSDVIVVDNDPDPGPLDLGKAGLPVDRLVPGRNLGFSGGMNVGIGAALDRGAAAVLLVNSDVIVPPGTAAALMHALRAHPDAGIVAPVVLDRQQPGRIASMGIHFNRWTGRMRNLEGGRPFDPEVPPPAWRRVDAVNGAVMLISRAAFERAGLFDEAYFFSFEEIEFCLRAADYGLISAVTGDAVAYHQGGASLAAGSSSRSYYAARNHLRLASRAGRAHRRTGVLARGMVVIILNVSHAVLARGGRRERLAATWRGIRDYARGRFGPDPLN